MFKNLSVKYYQKNKERLQKELAKYQNLSKEEKEKKRQYDHEHYKNLSEDEKQKLAEDRSKYCRTRKSPLL